ARTAPSMARSSVTFELPTLATQIFSPSKAIPNDPRPTGNVPRIVPSLVCTLLTVLPWPSLTQRLVPSKQRPIGAAPTVYWPRTDPSEGLTLSNLNPLSAQRLSPSNFKLNTPRGKSYSPRMAPSPARIFDSLVPEPIHMFRPSKAATIEGPDKA